MISESADFSGAEWEVITETVTYTIQEEIGGHTLYFKVKKTHSGSQLPCPALSITSPWWSEVKL